MRAASAGAIGTRTFPALGTFASLLVTDRRELELAFGLLAAELVAMDLACSRFRPDSELWRVNATSSPQPGSASSTRSPSPSNGGPCNAGPAAATISRKPPSPSPGWSPTGPPRGNHLRASPPGQDGLAPIVHLLVTRSGASTGTNGPGLITVSWVLCDCPPAQAAPQRAGGRPGHIAVLCNAAPGCRSVWHRPRHEPDVRGLRCRWE
jgi:hypothetical protein